MSPIKELWPVEAELVIKKLGIQRRQVHSNTQGELPWQAGTPGATTVYNFDDEYQLTVTNFTEQELGPVKTAIVYPSSIKKAVERAIAQVTKR